MSDIDSPSSASVDDSNDAMRLSAVGPARIAARFMSRHKFVAMVTT